MRAVLRPNRILFIETASSELARFHFLFAAPWRGHDPDMSRMLWIDVTFVVLSIHRARDHANIALMLRVCFARRSWRRLVRRGLGSGGFLAFFLFLFRKVLSVGIACERDVFSVWRPNQIAGAFRQIGKNKRIAAGHRQHCELWWLRLVIFFGRAQEQQEFSVW